MGWTFSHQKKFENSNAILIHDTNAQFAQKLINGKKTIETRGITIPKKLVNKEMELVTTLKGKRVSLGKIKFDKVTVYHPDSNQWNKDRTKHLVPKESKFNLKDKTRYGWIVKEIVKYDEPVSFPYKFTMSGIKYSK